MAYVLGFWFADGYIRHDRSYRIVFTSNDRQILRDINKALGANSPIRAAKHDRALRIIFHSKKLYKRINSLGGLRRKSRIISFPDVPKKFLKDFIRGYFDGDGSVFLQSYKATKNGKIYTDLRSNFTSGSKRFIYQLMIILSQDLGLIKKKLGFYNQGRSIKLGYGTKDTKKLLQYMYYPNFVIGLQRKAKFVSFIR